jgi:hypothetical protein
LIAESGDLDWDFDSKKFHKFSDERQEQYRVVMREAVKGIEGARSALEACVRKAWGRAEPKEEREQEEGAGRRVSLAPSRAGTSKVSLLP